MYVMFSYESELVHENVKKMFENMNLAKKRLENADKQVEIRYSNNSVGFKRHKFCFIRLYFAKLRHSSRFENFKLIFENFPKFWLMTLLVELFRDVVGHPRDEEIEDRLITKKVTVRSSKQEQTRTNVSFRFK